MTKHFWKWFAVFTVVTVISALTFRAGLAHETIFWLLTAATFGLTLHKLEWGIGIIFAELLIGSKGHLFWFTLAHDVSWGRIGLRLGLFAAVMGAWALLRLKKKKWPTLFMDSSLTYILPFLVMIVYAVFRGAMQGYPLGQVIGDANNWLFVFLVFPVVDMVKESPKVFDRVKEVVAPAISFVIAKAVFFFVVFASGAATLATWLYHFERQTGGGQMAPAADGMWRIYFWSELFLVPALVVLAGLLYAKWSGGCAKRKELIGVGVVTLGIVLTLFRSFWLGAIVAVAAWIVVMVLARKQIKLNMKVFVSVIVVMVLSAAVSVFAIQAVGQGLGSVSGGMPEIQKELFSSGEPGIQNRINQFKPMLAQVWSSPVVGSGFGTAITYESIDPRTAGEITTPALELGWLDMAMEMGLLGVILFCVWLVYIVKVLWEVLKKSPNQVYWALGLIAGGFGIAAVHTVSPFLNHPLGIGFIIFAYAYALRYSDHFSGAR